jgi:hypothetical protein
MSLSLLSLFLVFPVAESMAGLENPNSQEVTEHLKKLDAEICTLSEAKKAMKAEKIRFVNMALDQFDCTFMVSEYKHFVYV